MVQSSLAAGWAFGTPLSAVDSDRYVAEMTVAAELAGVPRLPEWARQMYGYGPPQPLTPGRRIEIRQSLGVLDAMFLSQPGVLEARQRTTVRMRVGRSA
jgi:hypothetical protein